MDPYYHKHHIRLKGAHTTGISVDVPQRRPILPADGLHPYDGLFPYLSDPIDFDLQSRSVDPADPPGRAPGPEDLPTPPAVSFALDRRGHRHYKTQYKRRA